MAVEHRCQRHGRPAVASRVRLRPDGTQETEYLCELDLAEERMSSRFGGRSLFDDFFSDFFDQGPSAGRVSAPTRQVERVDVTQFFSDATRELLQRAAQTALEWGSLDLDTDHLLPRAKSAARRFRSRTSGRGARGLMRRKWTHSAEGSV
jgi:ATP-dependent Clp protease ATP-binding subunit ClpC